MKYVNPCSPGESETAVGGAEDNGHVAADGSCVSLATPVESRQRRPPNVPWAPARSASVEEPVAAARVAVVSGANRGLGLQIVRMLAEHGMRVVLASRSVERGRVAVELLGDLADRVAVRQLDITEAASVARLVEWLHRRLGRCDVLVNNAGVLIDDERDAGSVDLDVVNRTLEINLFGAWRLTQAVVPLMRTRRYGRVVNVSSGLASLASMRRGLPAYRVSKCAVNALTRMLADELAEDGILVNACCPVPARIEAPGNHHSILPSTSADTPVWLATLPDDGPTGGFFRAREHLDW